MLTKMNFEFTDREGTGLRIINDMLMKVKFEYLEIEDFSGYLAKCTVFDPDGEKESVTYRYGFDSLTLSCRMAEDAEGSTYQLTAEVLPNNEDSDHVYKLWKDAYPNRQMCSMTMMNYESSRKNAAIILYCLDNSYFAH